MVTLQEINSTIVSGEFNADELQRIIQAVQFARNQLDRKVKSAIRVGTRVEWDSTRRGHGVMTGTVLKVNPKYIVIDTGAGNWRVPASMLRIVA
jgi:hypothetical protein